MLLGSVALAQQGLIVEPWRKPPAPAAALVPGLRAMPSSGLPQVGAAQQSERPLGSAMFPLPPAAGSPKWSPPVVELLVDPWAKVGVATPEPRPRWVPSAIEIVDPWADDAPPTEPRVASRAAGTPHSTIF